MFNDSVNNKSLQSSLISDSPSENYFREVCTYTEDGFSAPNGTLVDLWYNQDGCSGPLPLHFPFTNPVPTPLMPESSSGTGVLRDQGVHQADLLQDAQPELPAKRMATPTLFPWNFHWGYFRNACQSSSFDFL